MNEKKSSDLIRRRLNKKNQLDRSISKVILDKKPEVSFAYHKNIDAPDY